MASISGPNPKQDYWESIVLPPLSGLTPGSYVSPTITVSENGLITAISNSVIQLPAVANVSSLSSIPSPVQGTIAIVLDNGAGDISLYAYRTTPSPDWYVVKSPGGINPLNTAFTHASGASLSVGSVASTNIFKRMVITITTAFTAGTQFALTDSDSVNWMATTDLDATVPGTYEINLAGNNTPVGVGTELFLVRSGSPVAGAGLVYVEYI